MITLIGPEPPNGVSDPRLYEGLTDVLRPLSLEGLMSTMVYTNGTVTRNSLLKLGHVFAESDADTEVAIKKAVAGGRIAIDDQGVATPGEQSRQRVALHLRARSHTSPVWDGAWAMIAFPEGTDHPDVPAEIRTLLREDRLKQLRPGIWLRPNNLDTLDRLTQAASTSQVYFPSTVQLDRPRRMAASLWDLDTFSERSAALIEIAERFVELTRDSVGEHLPQGWMLLTALAARLGLDPLLPPALLPRAWAGDNLAVVSRSTALALRPELVRQLAIEFAPGS